MQTKMIVKTKWSRQCLGKSILCSPSWCICLKVYISTNEYFLCKSSASIRILSELIHQPPAKILSRMCFVQFSSSVVMWGRGIKTFESSGYLPICFQYDFCRGDTLRSVLNQQKFTSERKLSLEPVVTFSSAFRIEVHNKMTKIKEEIIGLPAEKTE